MKELYLEAIRRRAELSPERAALTTSGWTYGKLWEKGLEIARSDRLALRPRAEPEMIAELLGAVLAGKISGLDPNVGRAFKIAPSAIVAIDVPRTEDLFSASLALFALSQGATLALFDETASLAAIAADRPSIVVLPFHRLDVLEATSAIDLQTISILALRIERAASAALLESFIERMRRHGLRREAIVPFYASPARGLIAATARGAGPTIAVIDDVRLVSAGPIIPEVKRDAIPGEAVMHEGELVILGAIAPEAFPSIDARQRAIEAPIETAPRVRVSETEIEAWLTKWIAFETKASEDAIDPDASFRDLGLDSAKEVLMSAELERWLGRSLSATLTWDHPSVGRLAGHLAGDDET
jgi:acyl carrier protein